VSEDGKRLPMNADSEPRLIAVADLSDGTPVVRVVRTWVSHFATCPQAKEWRKPR
jgi:hypothetical protein